MCRHHVVTLAGEDKGDTALKWVTPFFLLQPPPLLPPLSLSSSAQMLPPPSFLSKRLLSGHARDPSVLLLSALYLSSLVCYHFLGLSLHAVCELIAASINGTVSDLKTALSSGSTLNHKNLIKVSHLYDI